VESARNLPLTRLKTQDRELPAADLRPEAVEQKGDVTVWKVAVRDVPLRTGPNPIEVQAANADGWSLEPKALTVTFEEPAPPKAEVTIRDPGQDLVVEESHYAVSFLVRSPSPLRKVELQRGGEAVYQAAGLSDLKKNA